MDEGPLASRRTWLRSAFALSTLRAWPGLPFRGLRVPMNVYHTPACAAARVALQVGHELRALKAMFEPHGVSAELAAPPQALPSLRPSIDSRHARDVAAALPAQTAVAVLVALRAADVDQPGAEVAGVTWQGPHALPVIFLTAARRPTTLAHEFGHWCGLAHVQTPDNLMSYCRADAAAYLTDAQGERLRAVARTRARQFHA